jgi:hypothetical protein
VSDWLTASEAFALGITPEQLRAACHAGKVLAQEWRRGCWQPMRPDRWRAPDIRPTSELDPYYRFRRTGVEALIAAAEPRRPAAEPAVRPVSDAELATWFAGYRAATPGPTQLGTVRGESRTRRSSDRATGKEALQPVL